MPAARTIRRWIGGLLLAGALTMLVLGQTVLKSKLHDADYIRYWMICFVLTGGALLVALIDVMMIKRETRNEQKELIDETLHEIEEVEKRDDKE
jgi:hypothetical protein